MAEDFPLFGPGVKIENSVDYECFFKIRIAEQVMRGTRGTIIWRGLKVNKVKKNRTPSSSEPVSLKQGKPKAARRAKVYQLYDLTRLLEHKAIFLLTYMGFPTGPSDPT